MEAPNEPLYSGPELAAAFAVTPRALRFYEAKGLLNPRRVGNRRVYDRRDRGRLQIILRGKRLGFSLAEIREYLELYDADASQTRQIKRLEKMVNARITDLERQRAALDITLEELRRIRDEVAAEMRGRGIEPASRDTASAHPPARGRKSARGRARETDVHGDTT
ncbi:MAG: MerR family DNA-binding transcriptional regulator [Gammaproteobacteria bacterium]|nr:MerR family DNA-binding transcriptional regulator [Gammaproteobacteria bacterium]